MERATKSSRISRVDLRYRHQAQDVSFPPEALQTRDAQAAEKEEEPSGEFGNDALLIREQKGRTVMGRSHRIYHRRQEDPSNIMATGVDVPPNVGDDAAVVPQETGVLPSIPPVQLPSVPAVPPFPSTLNVPTVPAYPWPSGVPPALPQEDSSVAISLTTLPTPTSILPTSLISETASNPSSNSTALSTITSSSASTITDSRSISSPTSSTTQSGSLSSDESSTGTLTSVSDLATPTPPPEGAPGIAPGEPAPAPAAPTIAAAGGGSGRDPTPLPTPHVVGSVIGSLAGAALILFLFLFLIKRHKRKGTMQLSGGADTADSEPIAASGQQMATRSSFVPAGAASFFNRFSATSRSTADTSTTGERGFQRISGRKLPSAFSEGMTSEQFARGDATLSGSSFYRDDQGFYGGPGVAASKEFGKDPAGPSNYGAIGTKERIMPSPARTPVIHHPEDAPPWGTSRNGGSTLSPPHSPNPDFPPKPTLGRSHPSHDGSRSSRFTENV